MFFLKKNTNELHCVNYLFISVASVLLSGYARYKVSIKNETATTIFAHLNQAYVSRNSPLDLRSCFVEDIECLLAF